MELVVSNDSYLDTFRKNMVPVKLFDEIAAQLSVPVTGKQLQTKYAKTKPLYIVCYIYIYICVCVCLVCVGVS